MSTMIVILLVGIAIWLGVDGFRKRRWAQAGAGVLLIAGTAFFLWIADFWAELLWFKALGYGDRYWGVFIVQILASTGGALFSAVAFYSLTREFSAHKRWVRYALLLLVTLAGFHWGFSHWETILQFIHAAPTEQTDPIFGMPVGFYLFRLPMIDALISFLLLLGGVALVASAADAFLQLRVDGGVDLGVQSNPVHTGAVYRNAGIFLIIMAVDKYVERFHLLYSQLGAVSGPGWTDVNVRLPAMLVAGGLMLLVGIVLMITPLRRRLHDRLAALSGDGWPIHAATLGAAAAIVFVVQVVLLSALPSLFQSLRVEPNEITFEAPYIANNIRWTRQGFRLDAVEEREYPAVDRFDARTVEENPAIFSNIRLWDWRALDSVYKQFQEIRLYYEFVDVDVDRYTIDGTYRQVMVSAREMELDNLPDQSQTFVNRRFKYTHGYGITMTNVSEFTDQGLPKLLIRDIPPRSRDASLTVERPEIYYGELTRTPVVVNTREAEFDYPAGDENATIRYQGNGGVRMTGAWRKLLYSLKYDGLRLLLSGYPTSDSRILFHRQIEARVSRLAPFLEFDEDPYIVLADGRLYWIIDAYTTTPAYPYSERFNDRPLTGAAAAPGVRGLHQFRGSNYVRNSVKAVVDAYDGSVDFYVFDTDDPLITTWRRVFPDLFKDRAAMPTALVRHVRYPSDMLLLQGLVYAKYHMTDPAVFYNQEDLWVRATEKYYDRVQPVEPYYIMWELPQSDHPEFVLMMPFTPKNRQVSIGWIAGMCDGDNYGRLVAYQFPKEKRVLGPQQVETKIDQDRFLSGQLTLWDQRGSRVIRGNVLAIPVDETLLYVEPIYLQAETAAYPELRLVALMHNDTLSYAESFDKALAGLLGGGGAGSAPVERAETAGRSAATWIRDAQEAFDGYLKAMGDQRFETAAAALARLKAAIQGLAHDFADPNENQPVSEPERDRGNPIEPIPGKPSAGPRP